MKYTMLGTTGTKISKLCLGTMNFGSATDEKESFRIMNRALELGINFFDTADFYGTPPGQGLTETIIGNWFEAEKSGMRSFLQPSATVPPANSESTIVDCLHIMSERPAMQV